MEAPFDLAKTRKSLATLKEEQRRAIGCMVCERLVPNYSRFEEVTGLSGFDALRQALDFAWEHIAGDQIDEAYLANLIVTCEMLIPDSNDFATHTVSMAIDAINATCLLLESFDGRSSEIVADICAVAVDSVDMFIQRTELNSSAQVGIREEQVILEHPLMQRELEQQREDFVDIATTTIDRAFVNHAKAMCAERGGNIVVL